MEVSVKINATEENNVVNKYKKSNEEQIEKKLKAWNTTRSIKVEQAKRFGMLNEKLERRVLYLNMLVVLLAILSFSIGGKGNENVTSGWLTSFSLAYSILIILLQNYISKLNLESLIKEFKLLEVNLDLIINELESLYRKYNRLSPQDKMLQDETFCVQIENLTNKYNMYLQNIPLHTSEDYNNYKNQSNEHKEQNNQTTQEYKFNSYWIANTLIFIGIIPLVILLFKVVLSVF